MAVWQALQIAVKRREVKSKGEKERYKHLNAKFQRIAMRDRKAFSSSVATAELSKFAGILSAALSSIIS